jgi:diguanylate cyclase (GGDEF)-like protein
MFDGGRGARLAARSIGLVLVAGAITSTIDAHVLRAASLPPGARWQMSVLTGLDLVTALAAFLLPWERWNPRWTFTLGVVALGLHTAFAVVGALPAAVTVAYLVVGAVWVGAFHPRRFAVLLCAVGVPAYVLPLAAQGAPAEDLVIAPVVAVVIVFVALAVEHGVRLHRTEHALAERYAQQLHAVAVAGRSISQLEPDRILDAGLDAVRSLGFRWAALELVEQDGATLLVRSDAGTSSTTRPLPLLRSLVDEATTPRLVSPVEMAGIAATELLPGEDKRVAAAVIDADLADGVLVAGYPTDHPAPRGLLESVDLIAQHLGSALATARTFERVQAERHQHAAAALRDELTGLGNRRAIDTALADLREGDVVVLLDLDHFKQVNDQHGHAVGDAVLRAVGAYLRSTVRRADDVGRIGGEEFLLLLRDVEDAVAAVERLLSGWRERDPLTTMSAGHATHVGTRSPQETIAAADRALYAAKAGGRDRAVAA